MEKYNIIIAGVGGQGVILAGNVIGAAALICGYDVKKTDTLGMAQRGGSVVSHLRIADEVFSPLIRWGEADILLAFEKLEAARWSHYLKPGGIAIVNDQALPPLSVNLGTKCYPGDAEIADLLRRQTEKLYKVAGSRKAEELGNIKTLNIFMLGCLSLFMPFGDDVWRSAVAQNLPPKAVALNIDAFAAGVAEVRDIMNEEAETRDAA